MKATIVSRRIERAGVTSGMYNTQESKSASSGLRALLKAKLKNCTLTHRTGHFECSGFVRKGEKVVYYSTGDFRQGAEHIMIRTAKDEKLM